jgi:hypothetical protein
MNKNNDFIQLNMAQYLMNNVAYWSPLTSMNDICFNFSIFWNMITYRTPWDLRREGCAASSRPGHPYRHSSSMSGSNQLFKGLSQLMRLLRQSIAVWIPFFRWCVIVRIQGSSVKANLTAFNKANLTNLLFLSSSYFRLQSPYIHYKIIIYSNFYNNFQDFVVSREK